MGDERALQLTNVLQDAHVVKRVIDIVQHAQAIETNSMQTISKPLPWWSRLARCVYTMRSISMAYCSALWISACGSTSPRLLLGVAWLEEDDDDASPAAAKWMVLPCTLQSGCNRRGAENRMDLTAHECTYANQSLPLKRHPDAMHCVSASSVKNPRDLLLIAIAPGRLIRLGRQTCDSSFTIDARK